ncbi:hypothetical protein HN51_008724, partial [Arachis hypogaea]
MSEYRLFNLNPRNTLPYPFILNTQKTAASPPPLITTTSFRSHAPTRVHYVALQAFNHLY